MCSSLGKIVMHFVLYLIGRYHSSCVGSLLPIPDKTEEVACPFCIYIKRGDISESETKAFVSALVYFAITT